eukprot:m.61997 g.61997  ORF g.61997 m.61997 type:complete len:255 (-) comp23067_c0_seq1:16-780(-)
MSNPHDVDETTVNNQSYEADFEPDVDDDERVLLIPGFDIHIRTKFKGVVFHKLCARAIRVAIANCAFAIVSNLLDLVLVLVLLRTELAWTIINFICYITINCIILYQGILGVRTKNASWRGRENCGYLNWYLVWCGLSLVLCTWSFLQIGLYFEREAECGSCPVDVDDVNRDCNTTDVLIYDNSTAIYTNVTNPMECYDTVFTWVGYLYLGITAVQTSLIVWCVLTMLKLLKQIKLQKDSETVVKNDLDREAST